LNYWDTSTLLKLYMTEQDSAYFINLVANSKNIVLTSDITKTELTATFYRKESVGELAKGKAQQHLEEFAEDISAGRIATVSLNEDVILLAEQLIKKGYTVPKPIMIRTLDVIHVASALASNASTLVATDTRLRDVAFMMGLKVLP
jgi:predicted nucleic acid-binding protein